MRPFSLQHLFELFFPFFRTWYQEMIQPQTLLKKTPSSLLSAGFATWFPGQSLQPSQTPPALLPLMGEPQKIVFIGSFRSLWLPLSFCPEVGGSKPRCLLNMPSSGLLGILASCAKSSFQQMRWLEDVLPLQQRLRVHVCSPDTFPVLGVGGRQPGQLGSQG